MNLKLRAWTCLGTAALAAVGLTGTGCEAVDKAAEACDIGCAAEGVAEGNASISGVASIDAFFGSVVAFNAEAEAIAAGIDGELAAIEVSVADEAGADFKAKLTAKLNAAVKGGLKVTAEPPKCQVSAKATIEAQAKCDVDVKPGEASVKCEGSCTADASAMASCTVDATLKCTGTAPNFECTGSCSGSCNLEVAANCTGTCKGTCNGTCSVKDASGQCNGECTGGTCEGSCELAAGGECEGKCEGSCTYDAPMGGCEASAEVKCEAKAEASVECKGTCEGKVEPPEAKAECEASAKADASINATCTPPSLQVNFQWSASLEADADGQAEFKAWLEGFKGHLSAILAYNAKIETLIAAGGEVAGSAEAAIKDSIEGLTASADIKVAVGVGCALDELPVAVSYMGESISSLEASASASVDVLAAAGLGGS